MANPSSLLTKQQWRAIASGLELHERQLQLVQCIVDGLNEDSMAEKLGLSSHTVHTHLKRLHRKLDVHNRSSLMTTVFAAHLICQRNSGIARKRSGR